MGGEGRGPGLLHISTLAQRPYTHAQNPHTHATNGLL
jgi:hypothetical protein